MKKWIIYIYLVLFAATTASAQWWKLGAGEEEAKQPQRQQMQRGPQGGQRPQLSEEKRAEMKAKNEQMKAERAATQKLAEAVRAETDPVKKVELTDQLRAKVTEHAEKMQAEFRKRLEKAEQGIEKMKERLADAANNKEQKIEEHLQEKGSASDYGIRPVPTFGKPRRSAGLFLICIFFTGLAFLFKVRNLQKEK